MDHIDNYLTQSDDNRPECTEKRDLAEEVREEILAAEVAYRDRDKEMHTGAARALALLKVAEALERLAAALEEGRRF